jgi:protein arginine N-methyltransferase 1
VSLVIDEHRQYLSDQPRVDAFVAAINQIVRPGDVVLDLGSGTGILGLLACRAGASRVYAIEADAIAGLTRELAASNGYGDRVEVIRELSTRARLPERADVLVTDQVGGFGFDAGFVGFVADARARLLTPQARTIPDRVRLEVCPCAAPDVSAWVRYWTTKPAGFDFDIVRPMAASTGYRAVIEPSDLLAPPALAAVLDPRDGAAPRLHSVCEFVAKRDGCADGLAGWFRAELAPGVEMTNAPHAKDRINRRHVVFPFDPPIPLSAGDRLRVDLHIWPADVFVSWSVGIERVGARTVEQRPRRSTFGGMLLAAEDLQHTRVDARPALTAAGRARLTVLSLADGSRTLADIEQVVAERHAELLPTPDAAAAFVAEVLTRYAQ